MVRLTRIGPWRSPVFGLVGAEVIIKTILFCKMNVSATVTRDINVSCSCGSHALLILFFEMLK